MKKFLAMLLVLVMMTVPISVSAEDTAEGDFEISVIDSLPRPGQVTLLTPEYSKGETGMSGNNIMEIVVVGDKIVSTDTVGAKIPENGYIIVLRGGELIRRMNEYAPKAGDKAMVTADNRYFIVLNNNYQPFYSVSISFEGFNKTRTENTIIIYDKGATSGTNIWGSEVVVDADGAVLSIGGNNNEIPEGGFVISAVGKERIAELENAASLGMSVSVDKTAKTVTFEFGKKTISASMNSKLVSYRAQIAECGKSYAVIDYDACHNYASSLEEILIRADAAVSSDNIADAMLASRDFDLLLEKAKLALTEYPAVEARVIWLRPDNSESRDKVNAIVKNIHEMGFNTVCIELLYDSTTIFPVDTAEYGFTQNPSLNGFDVLKAYVEECHKYGIEVHGWMPVYRVGYASSTYASLSIASVHQEWRCIAASGKDYVYNVYGNSWFLNPALPEVSDCLLKLYGYILDNYDIDAFQLDYVRYPLADGEMFGYDDYTLGLFEEKYGKNPRDIGKGDSLWQTWCEFRASFVTDFVKSVRALMDEKRPDMHLSASVAPNFKETYDKYMQEAEKWLEEGIIDIALPMAYGTNVVPTYAGYAVEAAGDGAFSYIGVSDYGVDVFTRQIEEARASGAEGVAFFSYSQYIAGNYAEKIKNGVFAVSALSPTYDASAAVSEQLSYVLMRVYAVCCVDDDAISIQNIDLVFDNIGPVLYKSVADMKAAAEKLIFDLENSDCADDVKAVLISDLKKAIKIAALSRDEAKDEYVKEHPLPEPDESTDVSDESSEPSAPSDESNTPDDGSQGATVSSSESEESLPDGDDGNIGIIIGVILAVAAATAGAVLVVLRSKRNKK